MAHLLDYATLRVLWWLLLGVLLAGFAVMDGFDLGAAIWLPFLGRNDAERRIVINSFGPVWEGNQVWLILGGGAIFAAWPMVYAVAFSGFYLAMFLVLCTLILRPVAIKYRSKHAAPRWRTLWDWALFVAGLVPALVFGVAVGNALLGVPFRFDGDLRMIYDGGLLGLFRPFAVLAGLVSVAMLAMHGGAFLASKAASPVTERARLAAALSALVVIVLFALAGWWATRLDGYRIVGVLAHDGPSNPVGKQAVQAAGAWLDNYRALPWLRVVPGLGFAGAALAALALALKWDKLAVFCSGLSVAGIVATAGVSMFPFILPSSLDPSMSLTVWDASSSRTTLVIMLVATLIFMPIILLYTAFVYRVLRGRVSAGQIEGETNSY
ncbi:MAG: cytochrome d ubiquinol oxidase subunit II [Alphaproteobacteria bacterium]|nr:cytochrome d ubiquinol oxidase subunit II [Alphaproteobacteria bacterium]